VSKKTHLLIFDGCILNGQASPVNKFRVKSAIFYRAAVIPNAFAPGRKMRRNTPGGVGLHARNVPLSAAKIFLDIPAHLDIEQTQNGMTSGHIVTAVHDQ
jgi:hypothetical protein